MEWGQGHWMKNIVLKLAKSQNQYACVKHKTKWKFKLIILYRSFVQYSIQFAMVMQSSA